MNMKNTAKYVAGLLGLMTIFSGCQFSDLQPEEKKTSVAGGKVKVYFNCITPEEATGARKAFASINFETYKYDLLAKETKEGPFTKLNGEKKVDYKTIYSGTEISPKTYYFQLEAYDGDNMVLAGSTDAIDLSAGYKHVNFVMRPQSGLKGSAKITVDFPDDSAVARVETCLTAVEAPFTPTQNQAKTFSAFEASPDYNRFKRFVLNYDELPSGTDIFAYIRIFDTADKIIASRLEAIEITGGAVAESKIYIEKLRTYAISLPLMKDGQKGAFPGKEILLKDKETGKEYVLKDDGNGNFTGSVSDGEYDIIMRDKGDSDSSIDTGLDFVVGGDANQDKINFITVTLPGDAGLHYTPVEGGGIPVPVDSEGNHEKNDDGDYEYLVPAGGNLVVNVSYEEGFEDDEDVAGGVTIGGKGVTPANPETKPDEFEDENVLTIHVPDGESKPDATVSGVKAKEFTIEYLKEGEEYNFKAVYTTKYTALTGAKLPKYSDVEYTGEGSFMLDGWKWTDAFGEVHVFADIPKGMAEHLILEPIWKEGVKVTQPEDWVEEEPEIPGNFTVAPTVFACGYSLIIKWSDEENGTGETNIYIDYDSDGEIDDGVDVQVSGSYNPSKTDFTGYRLKAANADGTQPASNFTYTVKGGRLASLTGLGWDAQNTSVVNISGKNTVIGNGVDVGVDLPSLTNEWVNIDKEMSGDYHITLETRHEFNKNEKTHKVAYIVNADYAQTSKFTCIKKDTKKELGLGFSNVKDKIIIYLKDPSPIHLPSAEEMQDGGLDVFVWNDSSNTVPMEFMLGSTALINERCSVFSISVKNGKFQLKETTMKKEDGSSLSTLNLGQTGPTAYSETLKTNTNYTYLHMFSQENMITPARATEFLRSIYFIKDSPDKEIEINLNLEAVPYEQIDAMQTQYDKTKYSISKFNYFDGSFYLGVKLASSKTIKWHDAYNESKQKVFNGMTGYLINITSEVENNYIFKRMGLGQCWTGGARLDGRDIFDTAEVPPTPFVTLDTAFKWQSGPEAGTVYTNGTISTTSGKTVKSGVYSSCSYSTKDGNYYLNVTKDVPSLAGKTVNYYNSSWSKLGSVEVESYDPVKKQLKLKSAPSSTSSILYVGETSLTLGTTQIQYSGRGKYSANYNAEYTNWDGGEPNDSCSGKSEQCMHFLSSGKWNDYAADYGSVYGYIVEFTPYENQWNTEKANYPSMKAQMTY